MRRIGAGLVALGVGAALVTATAGDRQHYDTRLARGDARRAWADGARLVAHAAGRIDGFAATNCREAFEASCRAGYRAIEVDFAETTDGRLVVRHDWREVTDRILGQARPTGAPGTPWSYTDFMRTPIHGRYHALDVDGLMALMVRYPGVTLVTDTKATDVTTTTRIFRALVRAARARDPLLLARIVPQFYGEPMAPAIRAIYPFSNWIFTLYQSRAGDDEVLAICRRQGVGAVAMAPYRFSPHFVARLAAAGIATYVHTMDKPARMAAYRRYGVFGFYTTSVPVGDSIINRTLNW